MIKSFTEIAKQHRKAADAAESLAKVQARKYGCDSSVAEDRKMLLFLKMDEEYYQRVYQKALNIINQ